MAFPASVLRAETVEIKIGSKAFTESVILGEMLTRLAEAAGVHASHRAELGGTQIAWQALLRGEIDAYVEYTGTLKEEIFAGRGLSSDAQIERVLAEEHIGMSRKLGFNNTYALAMREADAERLGVGKISDLVQYPDLRFGLSDEFMERKDGWQGLQSRYKLPKRISRWSTMPWPIAAWGPASSTSPISTPPTPKSSSTGSACWRTT